MIHRMILVGLCCIISLGSSFGQARDTDSQTLREILSELRAIHNDMRVTETTQLLVAELEMQQSAVNRATENADSARAKLDGIHRDQLQATAELQRAEDTLGKATADDEDYRMAVSSVVEERKASVAALQARERDSDATLQDMQLRLHAAQEKLSEIESELSSAISRLGPASREAEKK
jgi:hypothetical protein